MPRVETVINLLFSEIILMSKPVEDQSVSQSVSQSVIYLRMMSASSRLE